MPASENGFQPNPAEVNPAVAVPGDVPTTPTVEDAAEGGRAALRSRLQEHSITTMMQEADAAGEPISRQDAERMFEQMVGDAQRDIAQASQRAITAEQPFPVTPAANVGGRATQLALTSPQGKTFNWQQYLTELTPSAGGEGR